MGMTQFLTLTENYRVHSTDFWRWLQRSWQWL